MARRGRALRDETSTNVVHNDTDAHGQPVPGRPHVVTVRTPDARLVWYAPISSRSSSSDRGLGVTRRLCRYLFATTTPAGTSSTPNSLASSNARAHLIRHAKGVLELHPTQQRWAGQIIDVLREAAAASPKPLPTGANNSTTIYWPTCVNATTTRSGGALPPTATATGPRVTTQDTTSPHVSTTRPNRSGTSPETLPRLGQTTPASRPSKALNAIKPSPATGTLSPHPPDTAASDPTSSSSHNHGVRAIHAIHTALTGNPSLPHTYDSADITISTVNGHRSKRGVRKSTRSLN